MKKTIVYLILVIGCINVAFAQDYVFSSLYHQLPLLINPAYCGQENKTDYFVTYKQLNTDYLYHNQQIRAGASSLIDKYHTGIGIQFMNDYSFDNHNFFIKIPLAYHVKAQNFKLNFGLQPGYSSYQFSTQNLNALQVNDPALLNNSKINNFTLDGGISLNIKNLQFGIATTNPLSNSNDLNSIAFYNFNASYMYDMKNDFKINVLSFYKFQNPKVSQYEFTVQTIYKNNVILGAGYKSKNQYYGFIKLNVNSVFNLVESDLYFGYQYDNSLNTYIYNSNEIFIHYSLDKLPSPTNILKQKKNTHPIYF